MSDRTPAERRVDELGAELRRLRALPWTSERGARIRELETRKLPSAWRAVYAVRGR